ncbi:unnamed protein product [Schistosoma margrebowiei]|uniref:Uncharacterized protein n=1 Tax=Schistosoma margrebowiei TaxID=48269 RepID=A0A183MF62_9TREM|nr:unnamed protein product [Schistosoma margrebowiei]
MEAGDQQLVHTPFIPAGYWSPCAPSVWNPVKAPDIRFSSSHFRKQHPCHEEAGFLMKRGGGPNELDPPPKVSKTRESVDGDECVGDWQASLGCSLAERLEKITTVQHLTTRQVKRLLKDVLTNEDVVSALRRYIDGEFREPETGEVSAATRRRAKSLGLFSILSDLGENSDYHLESRAITRSLKNSNDNESTNPPNVVAPQQ